MKAKFYICEHCGNLVTTIHNAGVPLVCCGEKMKELVPNTVEASGDVFFCRGADCCAFCFYGPNGYAVAFCVVFVVISSFCFRNWHIITPCLFL